MPLHSAHSLDSRGRRVWWFFPKISSPPHFQFPLLFSFFQSGGRAFAMVSRSTFRLHCVTSVTTGLSHLSLPVSICTALPRKGNTKALCYKLRIWHIFLSISPPPCPVPAHILRALILLLRYPQKTTYGSSCSGCPQKSRHPELKKPPQTG